MQPPPCLHITRDYVAPSSPLHPAFLSLSSGNPLLAGGDVSFSVKRRWDEDCVFKNQARGEPKQQKRFINDTIRSDFHKRFLQRYIR